MRGSWLSAGFLLEQIAAVIVLSRCVIAFHCFWCEWWTLDQRGLHSTAVLPSYVFSNLECIQHQLSSSSSLAAVCGYVILRKSLDLMGMAICAVHGFAVVALRNQNGLVRGVRIPKGENLLAMLRFSAFSTRENGMRWRGTWVDFVAYERIWMLWLGSDYMEGGNFFKKLWLHQTTEFSATWIYFRKPKLYSMKQIRKTIFLSKEW